MCSCIFNAGRYLSCYWNQEPRQEIRLADVLNAHTHMKTKLENPQVPLALHDSNLWIWSQACRIPDYFRFLFEVGDFSGDIYIKI